MIECCRPTEIHRPVFMQWSRHPAAKHPSNSLQIDFADVLQEGFAGKKSERTGNLLQLLNTTKFHRVRKYPNRTLGTAGSGRLQPRPRPSRRDPHGPLGLLPKYQTSQPLCIVGSPIPGTDARPARGCRAAGRGRDEPASDVVHRMRKYPNRSLGTARGGLHEALSRPGQRALPIPLGLLPNCRACLPLRIVKPTITARAPS